MGTLGDELVELLEQNEFDKAAALLDGHGSLEAGVLRRALVRFDGGAGAWADSIASEKARLRKDLERGVSTLGSNAPVIGLFGTVIGVIVAFHQLAGGSGKGAMGSVMGGIAEALVATGVGLFAAIPAVVAYNVVQKKVGDVEGNIEVLARQRKRADSNVADQRTRTARAARQGQTSQGSVSLSAGVLGANGGLKSSPLSLSSG